MHIAFITRGIKHDVDRFIQELSAKYLPFKYKGQDKMLQVRVCPIQLWDVSFPKEFEANMKATIFQNGDPTGMSKARGKLAAILRKLMGFKKIEKFDPKGIDPLATYPITNTEVVGIGIKEDAMIKHKDGDYEGI